MWIYKYPTLYPGILVKRYKRFFADIELTSGELITAHCPNTGPMTGLCTPGSLVQVSLSDNPTRKLPYTWEMIQVNDNEPTWVGVNTNLPNRVVKLFQSSIGISDAALNTDPLISVPNLDLSSKDPISDLLTSTVSLPQAARNSYEHGYQTNLLASEDELILELKKFFFTKIDSYLQMRSEVVYGKDRKSRVDFLLTGEDSDRPIYLEVKSTTWAHGRLAVFPDTVTTRGQKHLQELMGILPHARAVMFYFINRGDCTHFAPGDRVDPTYGKLLREAVAQGLEVLPCRFEITPQGIRYLGLAEFCPFQPTEKILTGSNSPMLG